MNAIFGATYAEAYDRIYGEKDYGRECALLVDIFRKYAAQPVRSVLDLGTGTGSHAVRLAERGFQVLGVDRSGPMLAKAREKARELGPEASIAFTESDIRQFRTPRRFDAVLMMFAVLGYLTVDEDLSAGLATVRRHLNPGGLFVFDVWYAPAVEREGPTRRARLVATDERGDLRRIVSGELDRAARTCRVSIALERSVGGTVATETTEVHQMRYFDRREVEHFLSEAGLELRALTAFPSVERPPDETTWNVIGVAVAR
jgi:SAM-dependent methyltransferase